MLPTLLLLNTAFAEAWQADSSDIHFEGTEQTLVANSLDSGWMPANSSLQIRLQVNLSQEAFLSGDGTGNLEWDSNIPGEVGLSAAGQSSSGLFSVSGILEALISIKFDLPVLGASELDLFSQDIPLNGDASFSPFSWNNTTEVDVIGDGSEIISYSQSLPVIGSASLNGELRPNCVTGLTENYLGMSGDRLDATNSVLSYNSYIGDTTFSKTTVYYATVSSSCEIQLIPSLNVSAFGFSQSLDITQVDLPPVSQETVVGIQAGTTTFYLASASLSSPSVDFGSVEIDDSQNAEIILQNSGAATLEGTITLEDDSGAFEVFGNTINVASNSTSSIVVSFEALDANQLYEADLVIETNDPAQPVLIVPLSATTGTVEDGDSNDTSGDVDGLTDDPQKEGCSTVGGTGDIAWFAGLALLGFRRRR